MGYSQTLKVQTPISRHPAFIPLIAVWFGSLLAGCIAALAPEHFAVGATGLPVSLSKITAVVAAAIIGTGLGWLSARGIRKLQSGIAKMPRDEAGPAEQIELDPVPPLCVVEIEPPASTFEPCEVGNEHPVQPTETEPSATAVETQAPIEAPQRGKAVRLLRAGNTQDLSMPQLIERFAVALDDQRNRMSETAHSYSHISPPAEMLQRVRALVDTQTARTH